MVGLSVTAGAVAYWLVGSPEYFVGIALVSYIVQMLVIFSLDKVAMHKKMAEPIRIEEAEKFNFSDLHDEGRAIVVTDMPDKRLQ